MSAMIHLNLFIQSRGHHEASWRHPGASTLPLTDIRFYADCARMAEAAKFDSIFLADQLALGDDVAHAGRSDPGPTPDGAWFLARVWDEPGLGEAPEPRRGPRSRGGACDGARVAARLEDGTVTAADILALLRAHPQASTEALRDFCVALPWRERHDGAWRRTLHCWRATDAAWVEYDDGTRSGQPGWYTEADPGKRYATADAAKAATDEVLRAQGVVLDG